MIKKRYLIIIWLLSLIITVLWTYENPEKISKIKDKIKLYKPKHEFKDEKNNTDENFNVYESNHFILKIEKIASIEGKTSFLLKPSDMSLAIKNKSCWKHSDSKGCSSRC